MNALASSYPEPSPVPSIPPAPRAAPAHEFLSTPEFELLLVCQGEISGLERAGRTGSLVAEGIDWDKVLQLAEHHRLVSKVYEFLSPLPAVPARFLARLGARYRANARQALWLASELLRIVDDFASRGIEVLPYKGPTLAQMLYGDVSGRQFGDLDLLVRPADVPGAKAALMDLGYTRSLRFTEAEEKLYLKSGYEYPFDSAYGRNLVELKWQILPRFYCADFDVDAMFPRAAALPLAGRSLRTLCREDLLLVLCVHAGKHAWSRLCWLLDITQLARQELDWSAVEKQSKALGIERMVAVNFVLAQKLLGAPLPEMIRKSLAGDGASERVAGELVPLLSNGAEYDTESIGYFRLMMKVRERWRDRARFLWRLAFTPTAADWSSPQLPEALFPLYGLRRMLRLPGKLVKSLRF
jgi:Uncharacterised nucleotidyltransferase